MEISYSVHSMKRMKQRGITELEIQHILNHPTSIRKSFEGRKLAEATLNGRKIKVSFKEEGMFIKIITVM